MEVFPLTTDQRAQITALKAEINAVAGPYQTAQQAFRKYVTTITGGTQFQRVQISDDGTYLIVQ